MILEYASFINNLIQEYTSIIYIFIICFIEVTYDSRMDEFH